MAAAQIGQTERGYEVINFVLSLKEHDNGVLDRKFISVSDSGVFDIRRICSREVLSRADLFRAMKFEELFSNEDLLFMAEQQKKGIDSLNRTLIKAENVSILALTRDNGNTFSKDRRFYRISKPLLSSNELKAVLYVETSCGEDGCSNGTIFVIRKDTSSKKWELLYRVTMWME